MSHDKTLDSSESESLLGGQSMDLEMSSLLGPFSRKRGWSTSSFFVENKLSENTIECEVQQNDTLHSLALKYNVQVAEVKRVNNILGDGEFFALKKIKIPVRPASLLSEILPGDPTEQEHFENNNGWKVETKETPDKSLFSISVSSGQSSPGGV